MIAKKLAKKLHGLFNKRLFGAVLDLFTPNEETASTFQPLNIAHTTGVRRVHPGQEIREPKLTQRDYLLLKYLSSMIKENVQRFLSEQKHLLILDCGCGSKPYFPFFEGLSSMYIGIDLHKGEYVGIVGSTEKLPFKDSSFDVVLCTQVLEHTPSLRNLSVKFIGFESPWPFVLVNSWRLANS